MVRFQFRQINFFGVYTQVGQFLSDVIGQTGMVLRNQDYFIAWDLYTRSG